MFEESKCCKSFKIIFMDIEMPVKNGLETSLEIKKFFEEKDCLEFMPIIVACTGYNRDALD